MQRKMLGIYILWCISGKGLMMAAHDGEEPSAVSRVIGFNFFSGGGGG